MSVPNKPFVILSSNNLRTKYNSTTTGLIFNICLIDLVDLKLSYISIKGVTLMGGKYIHLSGLSRQSLMQPLMITFFFLDW